jgi:hypothetical protein
MNSLVRLLIILSLCGTVAGCSSLIIREDDSTGTVVGKVTARTLMAISTVGVSEQALVDIKNERRNRAWRQQRLPQDKTACLKEWDSYLEDQKLKRWFEQGPILLVSAIGQDYLGGASHMMDALGTMQEEDAFQSELKRAIALQPQVALLSNCSRRFHLDRLSSIR